MDSIKTGRFIRELRTERNLTQKDLAQKLNCTDKAVSRWETGKGLPDISFLQPLSEQLGVSMNELLLGERIPQEELSKKTDEALLNTLKSSKQKAGRMSKVIFALFCALQLLVFYALPPFAQPGDELALIFLLVFFTAAVAFAVGFTGEKSKWFFPLLQLAFFLPSAFMLIGMDTDDTAVYGLFFLGTGYALILLASGLRLLGSKIKYEYGKTKKE